MLIPAYKIQWINNWEIMIKNGTKISRKFMIIE
jgi:hypothetical protein